MSDDFLTERIVAAKLFLATHELSSTVCIVDALDELLQTAKQRIKFSSVVNLHELKLRLIFIYLCSVVCCPNHVNYLRHKRTWQRSKLRSE
jgi:hypothetical protein